MAVFLRTSLLLGASAALYEQGSASAATGCEGGECKAPTDHGEDVSYIQRLTSKAQMHASSSDGGAAGAKFFREGSEPELARPGDDYPEQLRGVIWMDQAGVYGKSDTGASAPDLLVSFAGSLDKGTRKSSVSPCGPTWTWQNSKEAYDLFSKLLRLGFTYDFEWNEDYTEARIYPAFHVLGKKVSVWSYLVDFRMTLQQTPAEGECPPKPGAPKEDVSKCALWLRKSWVVIYPRTWLTYPVFRVLDEAGAPIAPYYGEYVAFARTALDPGAGEAGSSLGDGVPDVEASLWFVGTGGAAPASGGAPPSSAVSDLMGVMPAFGVI